MKNYPQSRKANIVVQDLENEVLIYDLSINKAFCLNQISALVYQLCDGTRTVAQISNEMSVKLKTLVSEDLVWLALDGLRKDNLLENGNDLNSHFAGLSRREVVKRVGLASMVMLPIISSVVAPNAALAQSGCAANGAPCTFANSTQSNCCNSDQRCFPDVRSICIGCFAAPTRLASCQSAGCCNQRPDRNLCCSGTYNETQIGPDFVCECA